MIVVLRAILDYFAYLFHYVSVDSPCEVDAKPGASESIKHGLIKNIIS